MCAALARDAQGTRIFFGGRPVEVIAHRGFSAVAPENTLAAIRAAIEAGADRVEIDALSTQDGVPVVIHDADVERTTNGRGPVAQTTFRELRALDAGSWFDPRFAGERVPSLEEALAACRGRVRVNVEIKAEAVEAGTGAVPDGIEARVVAVVLGLGMTSSAVVSSFEPRALQRIRRLSPEIGLESLFDAARHKGLGPEAVCAEVGSRAFSCSVEEASPRWIAEAHRAGLRFQVYTADEPEAMEDLITLGVDGIFTNRPDRLLSLLGRKPPAANRQPL